MKKNKIRNMKCEICKNSFLCYSSSKTKCWCMVVKKIEIKINILDCICSDCIKKV